MAQAVIRCWVLDFRVYPSPPGDGLRQFCVFIGLNVCCALVVVKKNDFEQVDINGLSVTHSLDSLLFSV